VWLRCSCARLLSVAGAVELSTTARVTEIDAAAIERCAFSFARGSSVPIATCWGSVEDDRFWDVVRIAIDVHGDDESLEPSRPDEPLHRVLTASEEPVAAVFQPQREALEIAESVVADADDFARVADVLVWLWVRPLPYRAPLQ
jgi:hypothetical protein